MSLVRSTAIIGGFTLISRIFGFVRDVVIANQIGASWLSDAFFVAFKLPNFFRRLFAEGAFNAAFVPQFAGIMATGGKEAALKFASEALIVLLIALLLLNALFLIFMPWFLPLFAPGFTDDPDKFALTVTLSRVCFPYIVFISLVSLLSGILNSINRFWAVAFAPVLLNCCLIAALWWIPAETPAHALSYGVFIAGLVQLAFLAWICIRAEALPGIVLPRLSREVRKMLRLIAPAALGAGVAQINLLVDVILASQFPEGVSYLYYADRLNELPIGVVGVAVGTALLPSLSRHIRSGDLASARQQLCRAIEIVLLLGLPAGMALCVMPEPLIKVLYEHGKFSAEDTRATYLALLAFSTGLPAFVLIKVLAPGFFAAEDTKTPFYIATFCVALNLILNLILMQSMEHVGLALATSIAGWANALIMAYILYKRGQLVPDAALKKRVPRMIFATVVMGGIVGGGAYLLDFNGPLAEQIIYLSLLVVSGMVSYGLLILWLKAFPVDEVKRLLKRSAKQNPPDSGA